MARWKASPTDQERLSQRLVEVLGRRVLLLQEQAELAEKIMCADGEVAGLEAEIRHLAGSGAAEALAWNRVNRVGVPVRVPSPSGLVNRVTRSVAWDAGDGSAVVAVKGRTLPVPVAELVVVD